MSMYLVGSDVEMLCAMLDADPDIAHVRADGPGRWKAHRDVPRTLRDGHHAFWHVPSGPIELTSRKPKGPIKVVKNPFRSWKELVKPVHADEPWFGPGPLGIIWLRIRRVAGPADRTFSPFTLARPWTAPANEVIGLSEFQWVGNYYSILGYKADESTQRWWRSLGRRMSKVAPRIPRSGKIVATGGEVWAFPEALSRIRAGTHRADNPS